MDNSDEDECKSLSSSISLFNSLLCGMMALLCLSCFLCLRKHIRKANNIIMQTRRWRLAIQKSSKSSISLSSERLLKIALSVEKKDFFEINKIFHAEIKAHKGKARALCCLKVRQITLLAFGNIYLQLNKYETAPNFIQLSQNLTSDFLLISVDLPVFTSFCMAPSLKVQSNAV